MINDRGILAIVTLVYFILASIPCVIICRKHGFGRNGGFVFLLTFSVTRIAGSIAQIIAVNDPSVGAIIAAAVLTGSGFSTLLMAQIGILQRINEGIPSDKGRIPPIVFRVMILALIVAFALGITGGVYSAYSSPSAQSSAQTYQHAVGALFAASFGIMIIESALAVPRWHYIIRGDRKLLLAIGLAFPFMFVRLLYVEFNDFKVDYAVMNTISGSVVVQAFMSSLEEFIVVAIFLTAGWLTPRIERRQLNPARYVGDAARDGKTGGNVELGYGMAPKYGQQVSGSVQRA